MQRLLLITAAIAGTALCLTAQEQPPDSTVMLAPVEIRELIPPRLMGVRDGKIDSVALSYHKGVDLSHALRSSQALMVKTYGPGSVTTVSVRGTSSSHARVIWNGIPINSPTLGLSDLSNLPSFVADELELRYGAATTGSIGGELHLMTQTWLGTDHGENVQLFQRLSSTGNSSTGLKAGITAHNVSLSARLYRIVAENEFLYHDNSVPGPDYPLRVRKNARFLNEGGMMETGYRLSSRTYLRAGVWSNASERLIPSSLLVPEIDSNERQVDKALRIYAAVRHRLPAGVLDASLGVVDENMGYEQRAAGILSHFDTRALIQQLSYTRDIDARHRIRIGQWYESSRVSSRNDNYAANPGRNVGGFQTSIISKINSRGGYFMLVSGSIMNGEPLPPTPSLGMHYTLLRKIPLEANLNISRVYRVPTLNDLFWKPGGDPNLKAEDGIQGEMGLKCSHQIGSTTLKWDVNAFYGLVDGWIQWLPHPEYNYWTARNLRQVTTRGIEASAEPTVTAGEWKLKGRLHYSYTLSNSTRSAFNGDSSPGKQLVYTPKHQGAAYLWAGRGIAAAFLSIPYTGKRYTVADNTRYMPSFAILDAGMGIRKNIRKYQLELRFECNNLLNRDYQVIAWYPMPLRNYSINLTLQYYEP